jgi:predicted CXXCH cytochrome family protein
VKISNFKFQISNFLLPTAYCLLLTVLTACQPPVLTPKGEVINRPNPDFLKEAGVDEKTNPHRDEKCFVCHRASKEILTKGNPTEGEVIQRKMMRTDLIDLCSRCHKAAIEAGEHSVGISTKLNRENLPLDHQGNITCATTCHDVHTKDPGLAGRMLRKPFDTLCLSCHDV